MMCLKLARRTAIFLLIVAGLAACDHLARLEIASDDDEGGIIGTGILGTITDIGSIHVNGVRVVYDDDLPVQTAFDDVSPKLLRTGDTVYIEAFAEDGALKATSIQRYRPIIGPVQAIAESGDWFQAMGVRVEIGAGATLLRDDEPAEWHALEPGDWVAVDGLWHGDDIVASNVRHIPPRRLAAIRGVVGSGDDASLQVGGVRIEGIEPSRVEMGGIIAVRGKPDLRAEDPRILASQFAIPKFSPGIRRVIVEGFTSKPTPSGAYTVYGSGLTSFTDDPAMSAVSRRSLFCGRLDDFFDIQASVPLSADGGDQKTDDTSAASGDLSGLGCWGQDG